MASLIRPRRKKWKNVIEADDVHPKIYRWMLMNRIRGHNRKAKSLGVSGTFTVDEWLALVEECGSCCVLCGSKVGLTMDHIIPMPEGDNSIGNIQPLCLPCNAAKGNWIGPRPVFDHSLQVGIDAETLERLNGLVAVTGLSRSETVRQAIALFLASKEGKVNG
jgi:5-methylcytosine-specific restriction endonuclease McrA